MTARLCVVLAPSLGAALLGAAPARALVTRPCPQAPDLGCGVLRVALDRTGALPATLSLRVAVQPRRPGARGFLLALAGGPGQPSSACSSWA